MLRDLRVLRAFVMTMLAGCAPLVLASPASAQRLPATVVPDHYDLFFGIDLAHARFEGKTGIDVRVAQATNETTLHALEIEITSAQVSSHGRSQNAAVRLNAADQTATLTVPNRIAAGRARVELAYRAPLNDKLRGLYLSKSGKRSYAVT